MINKYISYKSKTNEEIRETIAHYFSELVESSKCYEEDLKELQLLEKIGWNKGRIYSVIYREEYSYASLSSV